MAFVLADPTYSVRIKQTDEHVDYDDFRSNDMKDRPKVPEDVMKPGSHEHVFCFAIQIAF